MPESPTLPEATLEVVHADGQRESVRISDSPFLIGRGSEAGNHLQLADKRVSRESAALVYDAGTFLVEDRGQCKGVFLNGESVSEPRPLRDGDVITLGSADTIQLIFQQGLARTSLPKLLQRLESAPSLAPGAREFQPLSLLLEATTLLQSHLPLEEALGAMVDRAIALTGADRGLLLEAEPGGGLRPLVARGREGRRLTPSDIRLSQTILADARRKRRSVVIEDVEGGGRLHPSTSVVEMKLRSLVAIPLQAVAPLRATDQTYVTTPASLLGVLYLDSQRPAGFSKLERQILEALGREAASVLDNARLLEKEKERQRFEQELSIAREIQQNLLPRKLRAGGHIEIAGINRPCLAVGGDYFDLIELDSDRTAFVLADVCGKGLGAALLTSMLQGSFAAISLGQALDQLVTHVNHFIHAHTDACRYATLFCGVLDAGGRLEFINAGHLPPLLVRDGRIERALNAQVVPLGLLDDAEFGAETLTLAPGDTLALYTDGVTEALNPAEEEFGLERLRATVAAHAAAAPAALQAALLKEVQRFTRGAPQFDDMTLLILRYRGRG
ncbi:MAG: SpoIIE family protein phosphatase [Terriglobia bacterium]